MFPYSENDCYLQMSDRIRQIFGFPEQQKFRIANVAEGQSAEVGMKKILSVRHLGITAPVWTGDSRRTGVLS